MNPLMEIKAADDNTLFGTAQGILLGLVCDTQDVCRTVKFTIVLVPGLKSFFSSVEEAQNMSKL